MRRVIKALLRSTGTGLMALLMLSGCGDRASRLPVNSITPTPATIVSSPGTTATPTILLTWEAPTMNNDGTALTISLAISSTTGKPAASTSTVNVGAQTSYHLTDLQDGRTYYFAVTAYDSSGKESTFSPEAHVVTPPTTQHTPRLSQTPLVPGQPAQFQVTGVSPGEMVYFLFSMEGEGDGPCASELGGLCVELLNPQVFGEVPADASGHAALTLPIPVRAQVGQSVATQAVIRRGRGGKILARRILLRLLSSKTASHMLRYYTAYGLQIASELQLPEILPGSARCPDVHI